MVYVKTWRLVIPGAALVSAHIRSVLETPRADTAIDLFGLGGVHAATLLRKGQNAIFE